MLKVYNTLSQRKEVFKPRKPGKVRKVNFFVCGPTVYDFSHIGHARTYIVFDMIAKYLRELRYRVFYLQNITDIDDKIIKRAKEKKVRPKELAKYFEKEHLKDMGDLKVNSITKYARATDYIKEIISQVKRLKEKGYAYEIEDGLYYDISKFEDYGKLSRRTVLQAEDAISRIDEAKEKRNKGDFCLWKFSKPDEPKWPSPWGDGRPGWHIEDTAITEKYFGKQYDIHGGARDLIFPHHEAEIAQMEAISGKKPMVKYWLHTGFLTVEGRKMSKSLGNFITIKDFLKKYSPRSEEARFAPTPKFGVGAARLLRLFIFKSHYRSPIDYNDKVILQARKEIERIDEFVEKLTTYNLQLTTKKRLAKALVLRTQKEFKRAMDDDLNTPTAIATVFHLINRGNYLISKNKISFADRKDILKTLRKFDRVFNFIFKKEKIKIPKNILELLKKREKYRKEKKWKEADIIRKKIKKLGYKIKDTKKGAKVY